ncbi:uncharacterized protein LOC126672881 [Mercurialis annua]|uniref:uncharacterized protein LOC126672881 n=1 Tax=Mercurialis annua TaxID=3986 RepID=UPI00215EA4CE|nr:uncharacterized protein LOC126672881 [Mercurialis annua]
MNIVGFRIDDPVNYISDPHPHHHQKSNHFLTPSEATTKPTIILEFRYVGALGRFTFLPRDDSILFLQEVRSPPASYRVRFPIWSSPSDKIHAKKQESEILRSIGINRETRLDIMNKLSTEIALYLKNSNINNVGHVLIAVNVVTMEGEIIEYSDYEEEFIRIAEMESMEDVKLIPASKSSIRKLEKLAVDDTPESSCRICLDEIETGNEAIRMPCLHCYHQDCIVQWLQISHFCPICRYEMPEELEELPI